MDIAHKVILGKDYEVEYKAEKDKPLSSQNGEVEVVKEAKKPAKAKEKTTAIEKK